MRNYSEEEFKKWIWIIEKYCRKYSESNEKEDEVYGEWFWKLKRRMDDE